MQLKLRRSQREGGVLSKSVIFCLDARAEFTAEELALMKRYKLHKECIYNSEAAKRWLDTDDAQDKGSLGGSLKGLGAVLMARLQLNITVESIQSGHHIECKSMDELFGAEDALDEACKNLRGYLDAAATFDGRELLIDYPSGGGKSEVIVATPAPAMVTERTSPMPVADYTPVPEALPSPNGMTSAPEPQATLAMQSAAISEDHASSDSIPYAIGRVLSGKGTSDQNAVAKAVGFILFLMLAFYAAA